MSAGQIATLRVTVQNPTNVDATKLVITNTLSHSLEVLDVTAHPAASVVYEEGRSTTLKWTVDSLPRISPNNIAILDIRVNIKIETPVRSIVSNGVTISTIDPSFMSGNTTHFELLTTEAENNALSGDSKHTNFIWDHYTDRTRLVTQVVNNGSEPVTGVVVIFDLSLNTYDATLSARNQLAELMLCSYRVALHQYYCELPWPYSFEPYDEAVFWIEVSHSSQFNRLVPTILTPTENGPLRVNPSFGYEVDSVRLLSPYSISCFIATAAYGSALEPEVEILRRFRNRYMLTNVPGRLMVDWYYSVSPSIAAIIVRDESLRTMTRGVLRPIIVIAKFPRLALYLFVISIVALIIRTWYVKKSTLNLPKSNQ